MFQDCFCATPRRYVETMLNSFKFDCVKGDEKCSKETENIRKEFKVFKFEKNHWKM